MSQGDAKVTASQEMSPLLTRPLQQSNKVNIMSPQSTAVQKKESNDEIAGLLDSTVVKENSNNTLVLDSSGVDDDIISFKPQKASNVEVDVEKADCGEIQIEQLTELDVALPSDKSHAVTVGTDAMEQLTAQMHSVKIDENKQAETKVVSPRLDTPPVEQFDPFKPGTQLANTPDKALSLNCDDQLKIAEKSDESETPLDSFGPSTQLVNSPDKPSDDSLKATGQVTSSERCDKADPAECGAPHAAVDSLTSKAHTIISPDTTGETADPFKPKAQLSNSLEKSDETADPYKHSAQFVKCPEKPEESDDPFKPEKQLVNSPEKTCDSAQPFECMEQLVNSFDKSNNAVDPFKPNAQLMNSPEKSESVDPFKPKTQLVNSPEKSDENVDPFKPKTQLVNSPEKSDGSVDPFKPKTQLINSPEKSDENVDSFKVKAQLVNSPEKSDGSVDPFKPKTLLVNSLEKSDENVDPFKAQTQLVNSPEKSDENVDSSKPKAQLVNSPEKSDGNVDPFKPKAQLVNSPEKSEENADSFKPKAQLVNSPEKSDGSVDPFKPKAQLVNSPEKSDGNVDPFKPKAQLINSLEKSDGSVDPFKPKAQLVNSPEKSDGNVDPFKPKAQLINSPEKSDGSVDPFKAKTQLVNSPEKSDGNVDPFKPKAQLVNSPEKSDGNVDPFKPKAQLVNSPEKSDGSVDPFKPKAQLVNSPEKSDGDVDPFKPKAQLVNSPEKSDGSVDPFKPKAQLVNSPEKSDGSVHPFKPKAQLVNSPKKSDGSVDPFKPKAQLVNSPEKSDGSVDPLKPRKLVNPTEKVQTEGSETPKQQLALGLKSEEGKKTKALSTTAESNASDDEKKRLSEQQSGSLLGAVGGNPVLLASGEELGISDDMFAPGMQVFNDPMAWEMLEQFGSKENKEANLRKCSLYVKFDPLCKGPLPKTPEKMPAPTHPAPRRTQLSSQDLMNFSGLDTSQMKSFMAEDSICLMGTPPRVARRRSVLNQRRMNTSVAASIAEEEHAKPLDLLLSIDGNSDGDKFLNDPSMTKQDKEAAARLVDIEEGAKYKEAEWLQMQQALSMQYEGQLLDRERQYAASMDEVTAKVTRLETELRVKDKENKSMRLVLKEYEKTINDVVVSKEKQTTEIEEIKKERDQALDDIQGLENSFSTLHKRFEKVKQVMDDMRKNEEVMKGYIKELQDKLKASNENMVKLKAKAEEKISEVVQRLEKKESELARMDAENKCIRLQVQSLENSLEQRTEERKKLTELCDTLIKQVGGN